MTKKEEINNVECQDSKSFWLFVILILVFLTTTLSRDITRPFSGLHSWAQASGTWAVRSHVKYGLGYTKGVSTWAVGMPPAENPERYWDHPQLNVLVASVFMKIFGINEWSLRIGDILAAVPALLVFMLLIRDISSNLLAITAGFVYLIFPLTGYFGMGGMPVLMGYLSMWMYLITAGYTSKTPKKFHYVILAITLFLGIQFSWTGFFFAMGIGVHYVLACLIKRKLPNWSLLLILAATPICSMILNFAVMAAGYDWDISKITALYKWRSAKGEMEQMQGFDWAAWFAKMWEFAVTNFTVAGLIAAIFYLTIGQLFVFAMPKDKIGKRELQFPCFWLFFLIPFFQLFVLKGCLWKHQTWEMPLAPFLAIAIALAIIGIGHLLNKRFHKYIAVAGQLIFVVIFLISCIIGTNYYYAIRWQPEAKLELQKTQPANPPR
jgi:4-amino-4-deoxy-L-arabinose transferase-like glycosyltransferase